MKIVCRSCGIHLPGEFQRTLQEGCDWWENQLLGDLSLESKRKLWDWLFSFDWDELLVKEKILVAAHLSRIGGYWKQEGNYWLPDEIN